MTKFSEKYSLLIMHLIVVILGFTGILGKLIELESSILVWYRMLFAFLILVVFVVLKKNIREVSKIDFVKILGIGVVVTAHWLFFFESIKVSNVSVAVVCMATSSLFSALLEPIFFKRKISWKEIILSVLVIIGLWYAINADTTYLKGYVFGVTAAFLATLFTILNSLFVNKVKSSNITLIEMLGGVIVLSAYLLYNDSFNISSMTLTVNDFIYLLILGGICTAFAFVISVEVMKYLSPFSVIMAVNLEPLYSILLALVIFNDGTETMNNSFYMGGSIIIIAVFLDGYLKTKTIKK
jgi:drug/metabolite transporter (DMT)-like permease